MAKTVKATDRIEQAAEAAPIHAETTTLAVVDNTPMDLIRLAMSKEIDVEKLGALFAMQERWEKNEAAKAFAAAIAAFQAECPPIVKRREVLNKDKQSVRYRFASWEDIAPEVNPLLAKHAIGVFFMIPPPTGAGAFQMTLRLRVGMHVEDYPFTAPMPDVKDVAAAIWCNEAQAYGSIISFFKRYHFVNTLNLTIVGEDNDAAMLLDKERATPEEVEEIRQRLKDNNRDEAAFLKWVQTFQPDAETMETIRASSVDKIMDQLNRLPRRK